MVCLCMDREIFFAWLACGCKFRWFGFGDWTRGSKAVYKSRLVELRFPARNSDGISQHSTSQHSTFAATAVATEVLPPLPLPPISHPSPIHPSRILPFHPTSAATITSIAIIHRQYINPSILCLLHTYILVLIPSLLLLLLRIIIVLRGCEGTRDMSSRYRTYSRRPRRRILLLLFPLLGQTRRRRMSPVVVIVIVIVIVIVAEVYKQHYSYYSHNHDDGVSGGGIHIPITNIPPPFLYRDTLRLRKFTVRRPRGLDPMTIP